jgi:hypothetical protein
VNDLSGYQVTIDRNINSELSKEIERKIDSGLSKEVNRISRIFRNFFRKT